MSHFLTPVFAPGFFQSEAVHIALGVGTLVAIATGTVGVFTVMRGQSFAGEAFGDIGTTGGSGAFLIGVGPLWGFVVGNLLAAAAMETIGIQRTRGRDLATGIVLGASIGLAALFLYLTTTEQSTTGATVTILFGSAFTIASSTVPLILLLSLLVLGLILMLYRPLLLATVSPEMAAARGIPVRLIGVLYLLALALAARFGGDHDRLDPRDCAARRPGRQRSTADQAPTACDAHRCRDGDRRDVARDRARLRQLRMAARRARVADELLRRDPRFRPLPTFRAARATTQTPL